MVHAGETHPRGRGIQGLRGEWSYLPRYQSTLSTVSCYLSSRGCDGVHRAYSLYATGTPVRNGDYRSLVGPLFMCICEMGLPAVLCMHPSEGVYGKVVHPMAGVCWLSGASDIGVPSLLRTHVDDMCLVLMYRPGMSPVGAKQAYLQSAPCATTRISESGKPLYGYVARDHGGFVIFAIRVPGCRSGVVRKGVSRTYSENN